MLCLVLGIYIIRCFFFFFKQKTAYEMRISDWSSDVCSSDLVVASAPSALSVTVYRAPDRDAGSIDLDDLGGFALISETRTVHLPAGVTRLRLEGVADGIDAATAILTGLPGAVTEKNRDAARITPLALLDASLGAPVAREGTKPPP